MYTARRVLCTPRGDDPASHSRDWTHQHTTSHAVQHDRRKRTIHVFVQRWVRTTILEERVPWSERAMNLARGLPG
jgi:hypothetical protein